MSETNQSPESSEPQVTINDIKHALQIIDAAAERGAFKGPELTAVGSVRDKLEAFVKSVAQSEAANDLSNGAAG